MFKGQRFVVYGAAVMLCGWLAPDCAEALYRGDEFERRGFTVGDRFFINRATYYPSLAAQDRFAQATNAFIGAGGSVSSDDLLLYQELKLSHALGGDLELNIGFLRDRDFDGKYQRFTMGLGYRPVAPWTVELVGEPLPDKEYADIGGAVEFNGARLYCRVQGLFPDFVFTDKNPDGARLHGDPFNLQLTMRYRAGSSWLFFGDGDLDFPLQQTNPTSSYRFDFEKYQMETGMIRFFEQGAYLRCSIEGEYTRKERSGLAPDDASDFHVAREYALVSAEYWRPLELDTYFRAGGQYIVFDEANTFPNAAFRLDSVDRRDHIVYAGRLWPVKNRFFLNSLFLMNALREKRETDYPDKPKSTNEWQFRAAGGLVFRGPRYEIEAGGALNLDQARFGGGFVKVYAGF